MYQDLHAFTVAFWIRTADETNAGTPLSYSVKLGNYLQENALVLKDYGNLGVQINNQTGITGGELNDGKWHHVAITWRSTDGIWVFYRDGKEASRAEDPIAKGLDLTDIFSTVNSVFFAVGFTCTRNGIQQKQKIENGLSFEHGSYWNDRLDHSRIRQTFEFGKSISTIRNKHPKIHRIVKFGCKIL